MASCPAGGAFFTGDVPPHGFLLPEQLDTDARLMADAAADFLRGEVLPVADRLQTQEPGLMPTLLRRAGALGLLGLDIPPEYGGLGLSRSASARIAEAVAVEPSFAVCHNVHTSVATLPILFFGTDEQKAAYLPRLADGQWIGAYALSESHAGSDALAARTRAVPSSDGRTYTVTGEKMWITNAAWADLFVVFACVEGSRGLTAFLIERGFPGVSIGREEHKLGLKGSSTCRLILDAVTVPAANRLGEIGAGAKVALYTLNLGRFKVAAGAVGQSKNLLGIAARYARQRTAFGRPIGEFGLIQEKLATMAARVFACESMLYRVAGYLDAAFAGIEPGAADAAARYAAAAEEYAIECALLKVACTETLDFCADECLQIHGGYGYTEEFPAARAWRDARVSRIYEGTNEINRLNMLHLLLKRLTGGRVTCGEGVPLEDVDPLQPDALRAVAACVLVYAQQQHADLADRQELCGALADILIEVFSDQSVGHRAARLLEDGRSQTRWQAAYQARAILMAEGRARVGAQVWRILSDDGGPNPDLWQPIARLLARRPDQIVTKQRELAHAVRAADGYVWS